MSDQIDEFKQFILSADPRSLIKQLRSDVKTPLISAQNLVNVLIMMQDPTPVVQQKIDNGELNASETLEQLTGFINQALHLIHFYRATLDEEKRVGPKRIDRYNMAESHSPAAQKRGFTFAEKALARAAGLPFVVAGQIVDAKPDVAMSHDNTAAIYQTFKKLG